MLDTVTYLVALMLLADIQGPSANVIRSMILLLVNYVEVSLDMALLFYLDNLKNISFKSALSAGVMEIWFRCQRELQLVSMQKF